jgi:hypothetical protein
LPSNAKGLHSAGLHCRRYCWSRGKECGEEIGSSSGDKVEEGLLGDGSLCSSKDGAGCGEGE